MAVVRGSVLRPASFLESLPEIGRDRVLAVTTPRRYRPKEVVVRQGEPADALFLVESGSLVVRYTTGAGDSVTLSVLGPGDVFGELGVLLADHERTATTEAVEDVVVRILRREDFEALRRLHEEVADFLLILLARRSDRLSRLVAEAHHLPVDRRIARRLLEVGRHFSKGVLPVVVPLTQDDVAQLAGATRPTTNQVLKRLEADGVLRLARGRVEILDVPGLRERARA